MNLQLEKAQQQFTGFGLASRGYDVIALITSMSLTKKEWEQLKKEGFVLTDLKESDFELIDAAWEKLELSDYLTLA